MTAEQEKHVSIIRKQYEAHRGRTYSAFTDFAPLVTELYENLGTVLYIIDDLQKQHPKRYTESELREAFNGWFSHPSFIRIDNFKQWIECARFLGMIKTEGES